MNTYNIQIKIMTNTDIPQCDLIDYLNTLINNSNVEMPFTPYKVWINDEYIVGPQD